MQVREECEQLSKEKAELLAGGKLGNTSGFLMSFVGSSHTHCKERGNEEMWGANYKVVHSA